MTEPELRQLLIDAVPTVAAPPDRIASVGARVRRHRRRTTIAASSALVGVALLSIPLLGAADKGLPSRPVVTPSAKDDGVLRTAGCGVVSYPPGPMVNGESAGNKEEIDALVDRIVPYAPANFPDVYTGLKLDNDNDLVQVWRLPSAEFDEWVRREFADACVEVRDARHSREGTAELAERIIDDLAYWRDRGIALHATGPRVDGSVFAEVAPNDVEAARRAFPERYDTQIPIDIEGMSSPAGTPQTDLSPSASRP